MKWIIEKYWTFAYGATWGIVQAALIGYDSDGESQIFEVCTTSYCCKPKKSKSRKTYLKPSDSLELSGSTRNYPEDAWLFNKKLESLQSKFTPITQSENYDSTDAFMYRIWISGKIKQLPHLCFEIGTSSIAQFISLHTVDGQTSTQGWDVRKLKKHQRDKLPGTTASVVCSSSVSLIITGHVSF